MLARSAIAINGQPLDQLTLEAPDLYEWQPITITCEPQPGMTSARLVVNDADLGAPTTTFGDPLWRWQWNPQRAVGRFTFDLVLTSGDRTQQHERFEIRILPRKIDVEAYEALINAVQHDARSIVYALGGGREGARVESDRRPDRSLVEEYWLLVDRHVGEALAIVKAIATQPHQSLAQTGAERPLHELDHIDAAALAQIAQAPLDHLDQDVVPALQRALRSNRSTTGGPLPRALPSQRSIASFECAEHRLLVYVLQVLQWRLGVVREMLVQEQRRRQTNAPVTGSATATIRTLIERSGVAQRRLRQALDQPWLQGIVASGAVAGPTHLMRHDPRYRRLYDLFRSLNRTPFLAFDCPILWLPIHDLPTLYEQWCVLRAVKVLLALGTIVDQSLLEERRQDDACPAGCVRFMLRLRQNQPLLVVEHADGTQVRLIYQRRYAPQPSAGTRLGALDPFVRVPDIAIEVMRAGSAPQVLIFDAKYRAMPDGSVPQDALDDAYAYRSAIGAAGKRATLGAFLLFPGDQPITTADQVGALPLKPDTTESFNDLIRHMLFSIREV